MDPYLWMATAAYVPNFVGLIAYLVMRKQFSMGILKCTNCSMEIKRDWKYCPNCSHRCVRKKLKYCHWQYFNFLHFPKLSNIV